MKPDLTQMKAADVKPPRRPQMPEPDRGGQDVPC